MKLLRARSTWSSIAAVLLTLSACSTTPEARTADQRATLDSGNRCVCGTETSNCDKGQTNPEMITIGDSLEIADANNAELCLTRPVDVDGTVFLPQLGAVELAGLTRPEIEGLLTEKYKPYFETLDIKVRIQPGDKKYFIFGEVATQGEQPFKGDMTIFEAVTKAQPRMASANLGRVRLIRADPRDPTITTIDLGRIIDTGDSTSNVHVQERDIIYVPAAEPKR